jgi:DNA-directed RNA polymerase specialized sigma24 family protein
MHTATETAENGGYGSHGRGGGAAIQPSKPMAAGSNPAGRATFTWPGEILGSNTVASPAGFPRPGCTVDELLRYVRAVAWRRASAAGLGHHDCEDAAQDAAVRLLERDLERVDWTRSPPEVRAYAARGAAWCVGEVVRRAGKWRARHGGEGAAELEPDGTALRGRSAARSPAIVVPTPADEVDAERARRLARRLTLEALLALEELDEPARLAVVAGLERGGKTRLASAVGVHDAQITRRQARGLRALRVAIGVAA